MLIKKLKKSVISKKLKIKKESMVVALGAHLILRKWIKLFKGI